MKPNYIPSDLTEKQTRLILRLSGRYSIGVAFSCSPARTTINECSQLAKLGYMQKCSTGWSCNAFYLTEKCQPVIDANN
jgi:hypothetical protein